MALLKGLFICVAWYYTILSGFYLLYCPALYLLFVNHQVYRKTVDCLFSLWELYPVGLFQCCCNTKVHHYGDNIVQNENTILIVNHRTRVDWNYVWSALYHASKDNDLEDGIFNATGANTKFVLKDELKTVPGLGWIMQMNYFLYLKRDWRQDQQNLCQFVDYYRTMKSRFRIVLFPEGTDLSEGNKIKSAEFAQRNNLPLLEHVLYPRSTGFAVLCSRLRNLDHGLASIYDVTLAYDKPPQTELNLIKGHLPGNVYIHFKRYSVIDIPKSEDDLRTWLNDRWKEKEISLRLFHQDGNFLDASDNKLPSLREPKPLTIAMVAFLFWSIVDVIFTFALVTSRIFQFWFLYHSILFVFITWKFEGFHNIQYKFLKK